jgi:hypothetical protein
MIARIWAIDGAFAPPEAPVPDEVWLNSGAAANRVRTTTDDNLMRRTHESMMSPGE